MPDSSYRGKIAIPAQGWAECQKVDWVTIKEGAFTHKQYPTCVCGKKYVTLPDYPKCIFCRSHE